MSDLPVLVAHITCLACFDGEDFSNRFRLSKVSGSIVSGEGHVASKEDPALADLPELEDPSNDAEDKDNNEKLRSSGSSESDTFEIVNANPADED